MSDLSLEDMRASITPNSDQLNYEDFATTGPQTFTITRVTRGNPKQPVYIHLAEVKGRTYRPGKSMRRLISKIWGPDPKNYPGKALTLYAEPNVTYGTETVGGVRISHMSHIDKPETRNLPQGRGRPPIAWTVQPLPMDDAAASVDEPGLIAQIHQTRTVDEITALAEHLKTIDAPAAAMEAARKQWANLTNTQGENQS